MKQANTEAAGIVKNLKPGQRVNTGWSGRRYTFKETITEAPTRGRGKKKSRKKLYVFEGLTKSDGNFTQSEDQLEKSFAGHALKLQS